MNMGHGRYGKALLYLLATMILLPWIEVFPGVVIPGAILLIVLFSRAIDGEES